MSLRVWMEASVIRHNISAEEWRCNPPGESPGSLYWPRQWGDYPGMHRVLQPVTHRKVEVLRLEDLYFSFLLRWLINDVWLCRERLSVNVNLACYIAQFSSTFLSAGKRWQVCHAKRFKPNGHYTKKKKKRQRWKGSLQLLDYETISCDSQTNGEPSDSCTRQTKSNSDKIKPSKC